MMPFRRIIQAHAVLTYCTLAFAISWGALLILVGPGGFPLPKDKSETPALAVLPLGPALAGLLLTALVSGRDGFVDLRDRLLHWRVGGRWYAAALPLPLLSAAVAYAFSLAFDDFSYELRMTDDKAALVLDGLFAALMVGILEETGWTGFATPRLRRTHGLLSTGLVLGITWGAWHFPMFWEDPSFNGLLPFALLLVRLFSWLPPFRIVLVWIHDRTGSLLVVMLVHAASSAVALIFAPSTDSDVLLMASILVPAAALWIAVAAIFATEGRRSREHARGRWSRAAHEQA